MVNLMSIIPKGYLIRFFKTKKDYLKAISKLESSHYQGEVCIVGKIPKGWQAIFLSDEAFLKKI